MHYGGGVALMAEGGQIAIHSMSRPKRSTGPVKCAAATARRAPAGREARTYALGAASPTMSVQIIDPEPASSPDVDLKGRLAKTGTRRQADLLALLLQAALYTPSPAARNSVSRETHPQFRTCTPETQK
jgi:hypothetical protein